jgi:hypothetical protein
MAAGGHDVQLPQMPKDRSDPVGLWNHCRNNLLATLDHQGALHREDSYWFGPMSIDELIGIVLWDPLAHAWDLAKAAGIEHVPDQPLAEASVAAITPRADVLRNWGPSVSLSRYPPTLIQ